MPANLNLKLRRKNRKLTKRFTKLNRRKLPFKKEQRKKEVKLRKNSPFTVIVFIFLWILTALLIFFTDPSTPGVLPLFFLLIFFALLFTFSLLFANSRRGLIASITICIFILLRYLGIGNIINLILLVGLAITAELYLSK